MSIEQQLQDLAKTKISWQPVLFDLSKPGEQQQVSELLASSKIQRVADDYQEEQQELFAINNPAQVFAPDFKGQFQKYFTDLKNKSPLWQQGRWVYFPWNATLAHILPEADFWRVRTARNQNLITAAEQEKFYHAAVGIGGMSVGSSVALALALQGGAKKMRLADFDHLALSNTNRILTGVDNLGERKVVMAARRIYEINPYAEVTIFPDGLTKDNIDQFCDGLNVIVDELDNLAIKYLIREQAKKRRLPVVMAADNGDNAVVDVERYDLDPDLPFFHGRLGEVSYDFLAGLDKFGIGKMITKHVGPENVTERMQQSLLEMGKTIVSWPQLGGAALINGAAVAYCVRKILNGQELESNRALVFLDEKLIPSYNSPAATEERATVAADFKKIFGL